MLCECEEPNTLIKSSRKPCPGYFIVMYKFFFRYSTRNSLGEQVYCDSYVLFFKVARSCSFTGQDSHRSSRLLVFCILQAWLAGDNHFGSGQRIYQCSCKVCRFIHDFRGTPEQVLLKQRVMYKNTSYITVVSYSTHYLRWSHIH